MMSGLGTIDGYDYYITNDSDDDERFVDSSDDEKQIDIDQFLDGTPKQQQRTLQKLTGGDDASSSEDEFEKAMEKELSVKMSVFEKSWAVGTAKPTTSGVRENLPIKASTSQSKEDSYYDDVYFDSDEETDNKSEKCSSKRKILSNDELFYDPKADDEDQKWVDKQRLRENNASNDASATQKAKVRAAKESDAILSCPACMTTLCLNCQRHESYQTQYRAMFVMNCTVEKGELLHYKQPKKKVFKRHKRKHPVSQSSASNDAETAEETNSYHPVQCQSCGTEVAVYDEDEVYHFFNVLVGHA